MKISEVMTTPVQTIRRRDSLAKGARLLYEQGGGCLAVIDPAGRIIGALTESSVCRATAFIQSPPMETPVGVAMSPDVPTLESSLTLEKAHDRMRQTGVRCALVVDAERRPIGVVTLDDMGRQAVQDLLSQCSSYRAEQVVRTLAETRPNVRRGLPSS